MKRKTYIDLEREVWDPGRCAGCGACVAVCPADAIIIENGPASVHPVHTGYCKDEHDGVPCGACYAVCPRTKETAAGEEEPLLGTCIDLVAAQSAFDVKRKQSGGAVTAILTHALDEALIDAVIVVGEDRLTLRPFSTLITSSGELARHAGSRYNWWVPTLASLKEAVVGRKCARIAVVGTPCVVEALAVMRESDHDLLRPYGRAIRLVIGLFCTESFDYEKLVGETLKGIHGIDPWQVQRLDVKGALEIHTTDGLVTRIPLGDLAACVRPGCAICTDLTARHADISAGAVGSPDGWTTLLVRNEMGKGLLARAVDAGAVVVGAGVDMDAIMRLAARKSERTQFAQPGN